MLPDRDEAHGEIPFEDQGQPLLPPRLTQEPVGRKNRRRIVVLVAQDGREVLVVHEELRATLRQIY